jgi:hypothetical protein
VTTRVGAGATGFEGGVLLGGLGPGGDLTGAAWMLLLAWLAGEVAGRAAAILGSTGGWLLVRWPSSDAGAPPLLDSPACGPPLTGLPTPLGTVEGRRGRGWDWTSRWLLRRD